MDTGMIKVGPVGSSTSSSSWDEKGNSKIAQIFVWYDKYQVRSLQFQYVAENGTLVTSSRHGPQVADKFKVIKLSLNPEEYLTRIGGYYRLYSSVKIISLTFVTNSGVYGPYGGKPLNGHKSFCFDLGENNFGGFHGSVDLNDGYLNSLGVYVRTT